MVPNVTFERDSLHQVPRQLALRVLATFSHLKTGGLLWRCYRKLIQYFDVDSGFNKEFTRLGPLLGPTTGPVIAGYVGPSLEIKWVFIIMACEDLQIWHQ